ncbi:glycerate dehydrogenase [Caballeronia terrestris]|uniref:Glycerate dehydrogenase n=2 Tax=Caballeronia terrestris TaxID=1226301 RepID=A0A158GW14_9BURK|nr:glycerate dehydrogenase [Caballeronia terrestris]
MKPIYAEQFSTDSEQTMNASPPPKIVFLDRATISPQTVLKELPFDHDLTLFDQTTREEIAARIAESDIVICNKVPLQADVLAAASKLKFIAVAATGTDNVDLEYCKSRGIIVSNIREYATNTVPEHAFALIFALRRSLVAYRDAVQRGRWQAARQFCFFDFPIRDIRGSTIGIVGDGALGRAVGDIAKALGMKVLYSAYKGRLDMGPLYTPFEEMLRRSDIITLHCPLMASTIDLISDDEFGMMERRPLLINTARGGLVNEEALVSALSSGRISGAGFDVVTQEPLPNDHPFNAILNAPNFILTPHVAWASDEAVQSLADQLFDNVATFWSGNPKNVVSG